MSRAKRPGALKFNREEPAEMPPWNGEERRSEYCPNHAQKDLDISDLKDDVSAIKGSWATIKWIWPIVFGIVTAILGFAISYVLNDIKSTLNDMKGGIQQIQRDVETLKVSAATDRANIMSLGAEVADLKFALRQSDPRQVLFMKRPN